jgi:hypothetical protein
LDGFVKACLSGGVMALAIWGWLSITGGQSIWLTALGGIVVGVGVYGLMIVLLRVPEVKLVFDGIKRRFSKNTL